MAHDQDVEAKTRDLFWRRLLAAPGRLVAALLQPSRDFARRRREHPDGGVCWACGIGLPNHLTECVDCCDARQW